jgi:hypothetical protein
MPCPCGLRQEMQAVLWRGDGGLSASAGQSSSAGVRHRSDEFSAGRQKIDGSERGMVGVNG